jgi:predicted lipoprotein with Yx(FWY)xxD motif
MRTHTIPIAALGAAALLSGCGSSSKSTATIAPAASGASANATAVANTSSGPGLILAASHYGKVIFDSHHRALYLFAADHGSTSTCYGTCAKVWPPLLSAGAATAGPGLASSLLGVTRRSDGSTQVTYAGHPLYYFAEDRGAGIACQDANSQGGYWYVVNADGSANKAHGEMMMHHAMRHAMHHAMHHHAMHHTQSSTSAPSA